MAQVHIDFDRKKIEELARRWNIIRIQLFGSVLRDDFNPQSDIDVLVRFLCGVKVDLMDFIDIQSEFEAVFGRQIDLVEEGSIRNPYRQKNIDQNKEVIYAAAG